MKKCLFSALSFSLLLGSATAQQKELYHKVRWHVDPAAQQAFTATYGTDHFHGGKHGLETEMSESEIARIKADGYTYTVLQEDMERFYAERLAAKSGGSTRDNCNPEPYNDPAGFNTGGMGGYLTYAQILQELDDMAAQYPNIFKGRAQIGSFVTHQNRPLYWVKISDNASADENEPRLLYSAHIHAREAISGMQLLYFMWYILENYATDPEIKYLVDNAELYFIPVLNPDGVIRNETQSPGGGGMHRKNMRSVGTSNPGVDLNRNFGVQWNTTGVSANTNDDTYPGPSAFSEPETQALKWFAEQYDFAASFTHHSYSNLLLYPYGYANVLTPDDAYFAAFTEEMVSVNNFSNIRSVDLYPASGDTDDWLYDVTPDKPKVLALTPESGGSDDGFWPAQNRILPMCRANLKMNTDLVRLVLKTALAKDRSSRYLPANSGYIAYDFSRYGMQNGNFSVSLTPLGSGIQSTGAAITYTNPVQLQVYNDSIAYTLNSGLPEGTVLKFLLTVNNGTFSKSDTLEKIYGTPLAILDNDASSLSGFTMQGGSWGTTTNTFVSAPSSITDSPNGNYSNNQNKRIVLSTPVDLSASNLQEALLRFWAKWDVEAAYDYVQVEASTDNGVSWTPLCGKYTHAGTADQAEGEPLYDGTQPDWVQEEISLGSYLGQSVTIRFQLVTDPGVVGDGFYFDDLEILTISSDTSSNNTSLQSVATNTLQLFPNPAETQVTVKGITPGSDLSLLSTTGQVLQYVPNAGDVYTLSLEALRPGLYFIRTGGHTLRFLKK